MPYSCRCLNCCWYCNVVSLLLQCCCIIVAFKLPYSCRCLNCCCNVVAFKMLYSCWCRNSCWYCSVVALLLHLNCTTVTGSCNLIAVALLLHCCCTVVAFKLPYSCWYLNSGWYCNVVAMLLNCCCTVVALPWGYQDLRGLRDDLSPWDISGYFGIFRGMLPWCSVTGDVTWADAMLTNLSKKLLHSITVLPLHPTATAVSRLFQLIIAWSPQNPNLSPT